MSMPGLKRPNHPELQEQLAQQLPAYLSGQRWFAGKAREIRSADVVDFFSFPDIAGESFVLCVRVEYGDRGEEIYLLPVTRAEGHGTGSAEDAGRILSVRLSGDRHLRMTDGLENEEFRQALLRFIGESGVLEGMRGQLRAMPTQQFSDLRARGGLVMPSKLLRGEQSNSSIVYGDQLILKLFRRLQQGVNPDLEIGLFLTGKAYFPNTPPVAGWLEYQLGDGEIATAGILQGFVPNQGDAWKFTLQQLAEFWPRAEQVAASSRPRTQAGITALDEEELVPLELRETVEQYLAAAKLLATRTAQLHLALASEPSDAAFAPEPFTGSFQRELETSIRELAQRNLALLRSKAEALSSDARLLATNILDRDGEILDKIHRALDQPFHAQRTRIHGDYHLGQVLYTGSDFILIDFEGEPARPISERRRKRSPLQDVAGMLRSFHYAAHSSLHSYGDASPSRISMDELREWAEQWYGWVGSSFVRQYLAESAEATYLPAEPAEFWKLLELHLLEKAIYEVGYELNNRPAWVGIPLSGIAALLL